MEKESNYRWWPEQRAPQRVVRVRIGQESGSESDPIAGPMGSEHMLAQSLAGLAARAVNAGLFDEMVWIDLGNPEYDRWYRGAVSRLNLAESGSADVWALAGRYHGAGIVNGYVLYDAGSPAVNAATVAAGALGGILVERQLQHRADALGLSCLLDSRGLDDAWAFERFKDSLSRTLVLAQDPAKPHARAMAIAHGLMVLYGDGPTTTAVYRWLEPLSAVIGWNAGEEGDFVQHLSRHGHIMVASDWSLNLELLCAASQADVPAKPLRAIEPVRLAPDDSAPCVSFVMSDGDNLQWMMGAFFNQQRFWASSAMGTFPAGFTTCLADLSQACPDAVGLLADTQPPETSVLMFGGGYFYPDLFASVYPAEQRRKLLARHARRVGWHMRRTGCRTLLFIAMELDTPAALEAYDIFAREIEELAGMFVMKYSPYEGGEGRIFWTRSARGEAIPVVSCSYSLWANLPFPRSGTPGEIAGQINAAVAESHFGGVERCEWVVIHAWSVFQDQASRDPQAAEHAAPGPVGTAMESDNGLAGLAAAGQCVSLLDKAVRVVSPEELVWRIRARRRSGRRT